MQTKKETKSEITSSTIFKNSEYKEMFCNEWIRVTGELKNSKVDLKRIPITCHYSLS